MKFRSMILVLTIAFSAIFVSMLGTSYAYYVATDGTKLNVTTGNIDTGVATIFAQSQYINVYTGVPINASDVNSLASASTFTLTPDTTILENAEVAVDISIVDLSIDKALVIDDFKYSFVCDDGSSDVITVNGTGTNFTNDVISSGYLKLGTLSTTNNTFNVNNSYTCTLRVWLQESGNNQNALMNKKFRGLIKVNTLFKN